MPLSLPITLPIPPNCHDEQKFNTLMYNNLNLYFKNQPIPMQQQQFHIQYFILPFVQDPSSPPVSVISFKRFSPYIFIRYQSRIFKCHSSILTVLSCAHCIKPALKPHLSIVGNEFIYDNYTFRIGKMFSNTKFSRVYLEFEHHSSWKLLDVSNLYTQISKNFVNHSIFFALQQLQRDSKMVSHIVQALQKLVSFPQAKWKLYSHQSTENFDHPKMIQYIFFKYFGTTQTILKGLTPNVAKN